MAPPQHQSAFTILAPVPQESRARDLAALLDSLDPTRGSDPRLAFAQHEDLHYCSFVLIEREDARYLAFEGNIDGDRDPFLRAFVDRNEAVLREIYAHCEGGERGGVYDYLRAHDIGAGTWYVAWRGRGLRDIRAEARLREAIEDFLDGRPDLEKQTPAAVRGAIQAHVQDDAELAALAANPPERPFALRVLGPFLDRYLAPTGIGLGLLLLWLLRVSIGWGGIALVAVLIAAGAVYLRRLEARDEAGGEDWDESALADAEAREDLALQNHMCNVTYVKPGRFRLLVLKTALAVVGTAHRLYFNRGALGGIPTIHFARWVFAENDRHLVFFSNFDGSWERYLGDFIDRASAGLNSIWSNTRSYPRTRFLFGGGARDELRFKVFARNSMRGATTRVWYAAYPGLSVQNIENSARIREDLFRPLGDEEVVAWLRRL